MLTNIFNPLGKGTTYVQGKAPWDATKTYWHFTHKDWYPQFTSIIETFWDIQSGDLKWVLVKKTNEIMEVLNGLEPASFTDADFQLPGCTPTASDVEVEARDQLIGRNPLRRLAKEAKRAARQARRAARKAEAASKKIDEALQNMKRQ